MLTAVFYFLVAMDFSNSPLSNTNYLCFVETSGFAGAYSIAADKNTACKSALDECKKEYKVDCFIK